MRWVWLLLTASVVLAEAGSAFYRFMADTWNAGASHPPVLRFQMPYELRHLYRQMEVEPRQVAELSFDRASRYLASLPGGAGVEIVSIEYDGGNKNHWMDAYLHTPERCMNLAGCEVGEVYPERTVPASGQEVLWVRATRVVTGNSTDFYVFRGNWIPHYAEVFPHQENTIKREWTSKPVRLKQAFSLHPTPPGLIHVAGVRGARSYEEACRIFEEFAVKPLRLMKAES